MLLGDLCPRNFYIFGSGISFSISPTIHNTGFKHHNLPHTYQIQETTSIDDVAHLISSPSFGGASVTMPHKLQVHKFCDDQTETARAIGAVNTLVAKGAGSERRIIGDNTDWSGLHSIITTYSSRTGHKPVVGLVIGAGGASRAALYSVYKAGVRDIYLVNRTSSTAMKVRDDLSSIFNITVIPDVTDLPRSPDLVIGTVPAETTTEDRFSTLFQGKGLCIDMSYKPHQTPLLTVAQNCPGWVTVTGVEVLLAQAFDQFRLWTGLEPPKDTMTKAALGKEAQGYRTAMI